MNFRGITLQFIIIVAQFSKVLSATLDDSEARRLLLDKGISLSRPYPSLNFDGVQKITIDTIISLKNYSNCPIEITGATEASPEETGLLKHSCGHKLDISLNTCIDKFIVDEFTEVTHETDNEQVVKTYKSLAGNTYAKHTDHWDITFVDQVSNMDVHHDHHGSHHDHH